MFNLSEIVIACSLLLVAILGYQLLWYPLRRSFQNKQSIKAFFIRFIKRLITIFSPVIFVFSNHDFLIYIGMILTICLLLCTLIEAHKVLFGWRHLIESKSPLLMSTKEILMSIRLVPLSGFKNYLICIFSFTLLNISLFRLSSGGHFTVSQCSDFLFIDFLYFTTVTMATLGYGDIVPHSFIARLFLTLETLASVFFLIVLLGAVVGNYSSLMQVLNEKKTKRLED